MSNTDADLELELAPEGDDPAHPDAAIEQYAPKKVTLGEDALTVRRTLPNMSRSFVGAWCFVDHYGPEEGVCMDVPPHPHTSLQTVSWLFSGEIEHRDSAGVHEMVRPGEVNLMTSGHGIAHSEVSTDRRDILHGVQLWTVLPEGSKDLARDFQHFVPEVWDDHDAPGDLLALGVGQRVEGLADAGVPQGRGEGVRHLDGAGRLVQRDRRLDGVTRLDAERGADLPAQADHVPAAHHRQPQPLGVVADRDRHRGSSAAAEGVHLLVGEDQGGGRPGRLDQRGQREGHGVTVRFASARTVSTVSASAAVLSSR